MFKFFQIIIASIVLAGCALKPSIDDVKLSDKTFRLEQFFDGKVKAYGQFQDLLGNVSRRFVVDLEGSWDGEAFTLVEDFTYSDDSTEQRIWTLAKGEGGTWTGDAKGVIGEVKGKIEGDTFYWAYKVDLPLPDAEMRVSFDDYMWLLDDDRVLNIAYMSKWGVPLGQVTIMFEKL